MNAQCSPEPYRLTADGRLEKSGLYHQMKSFKTKPIEDIITSLMKKVKINMDLLEIILYILLVLASLLTILLISAYIYHYTRKRK